MGFNNIFDGFNKPYLEIFFFFIKELDDFIIDELGLLDSSWPRLAAKSLNCDCSSSCLSSESPFSLELMSQNTDLLNFLNWVFSKGFR